MELSEAMSELSEAAHGEMSGACSGSGSARGGPYGVVKVEEVGVSSAASRCRE